MLRWVFLIRYPDGVAVEDGEQWYLNVHAAEAKHMKGLKRYLTWNLQEAPEAAAGRTREQLNRWVRLTELHFESWEAWRTAVVEEPLKFTPAPWAQPQQGTASASYLSETIFLLDEPQFDLLSGDGS